MSDNEKVTYVLTYDAPHRKTQDLLFRLKVKGYKKIVVLITPWIERKNFISLIPHRQFNVLSVNPQDLCQFLNYESIKVETDQLFNYFKNHEEGLILIGGAGILPKEIAKLGKVINSHPAYLPYMRGLDSLKWSIYYDKPIGVTTHFISSECDAGLLIKREFVPLYSWDTFHSVAQRQYELEVDMLVNSLQDIKTACLKELSTTEASAMRRMPHIIETRLMERFQKIIDKVDIDGHDFASLGYGLPSLEEK